jgi:hypothetical protein
LAVDEESTGERDLIRRGVFSHDVSQGPPGWFLILWLLAVVGAAAAWVVYLRLQAESLPRRQLGDRAQPPAVLVSTVGGGRVGMMNYTFPFVRFALDKEGVVFRFPFSTASVGWGDITRAVLIQPMIPAGKGVEFQLHRSQPLTVWAAADMCAKILDLCEQHGVEVVRESTLRV